MEGVETANKEINRNRLLHDDLGVKTSLQVNQQSLGNVTHGEHPISQFVDVLLDGPILRCKAVVRVLFELVTVARLAVGRPETVTPTATDFLDPSEIVSVNDRLDFADGEFDLGAVFGNGFSDEDVVVNLRRHGNEESV